MNRQQVNDSRVLSFARARTVAFVCECADDDCKRAVLMSPFAFIARRESGEAILHPGHEPLADAPMAAERAATAEPGTRRKTAVKTG
jgi:hypothetical protein